MSILVFSPVYLFLRGPLPYMYLGLYSFTYFQSISKNHILALWQYGLWSFQTGGTKFERFLPQNQCTQRKLFNFENWISGGLRSFQNFKVLKVNYFHLLSRKKYLKLKSRLKMLQGLFLV